MTVFITINTEAIDMQTDFKTYMDPLIIGQIADTSPRTIDSHAAEASIEFGMAVMRGTNGRRQCLPLDDAEAFLGVAIRNDLCLEGYYSEGEVVSVMRKGRVAVITTEAVLAGDKAYVHSDGTFNKTKEGGFEVGIFFDNKESENGLVILELQTVVHLPIIAKKVNTKTPTNLLD